MSLNWNIQDVRDSDELKTDENWPLVNTMIFATIAVGIGDLSKETAPNFYARMKATGNYPEIEPHHVERLIGLRTNVSYETDLQWIKRWFTYEIRDRKREYDRKVNNGDHSKTN